MRVACPWFEPVREFDLTDYPRPARAPLGTIFDGLCHASGQPVPREPDLVREPCNFGYGRDRCRYFPADSEADAVRFSTRGGRLIWILEKDFAPVRHGFCDQDVPAETIARQAEAFAKTCR